MREKVKSILQKISPFLNLVKKINTPKNRSTFIVIVLFLSIATATVPLVKSRIAKKNSVPLGATDQSALMAIPRPPETSNFLVFSSETRNVASSSCDVYDIFPDMPIDSSSFYFKEKSGIMEFESAIFCIDWNKADSVVRKKLISIQKDGEESVENLLGEKPLLFERERDLEGIQVYRLKYPLIGEVTMSSYGNCIMLGRDRQAIIDSIIAIRYSMTRLSWDESVCQASRTFIDRDRRYLFFLKTSRPGKIRELPNRHVQSLAIDRLRDMAINRTDPDGKTRSILKWLTREENKDGQDEKDNTYASDAIDLFIAQRHRSSGNY